ncbi:hypothetical protein P280DRAFT_545921 [Massarina eburnea CBS 473.64]|uniref:RTA1 like protein n=1 Tax=Massarina eburnea CBS 473.64 TaxID=1395130 RepID=A0A6A6SA43_9PLEO|nr:hypothetical protein P280DRAFT_545921 [Massarina eburnea CBS 473.64]
MTSSNIYATAFYLTTFAILLPIQLSIGLQRKTYTFLASILLGLGFEILSYVARILVYSNHDYIAVYLVSITIGPTFISAEISLCLAEIVDFCGTDLLPVPVRMYRVASLLAHSIALGLQTIGSGVSRVHYMETAAKILQTGSTVHLIAMTVSITLASVFARNAYTRPSKHQTSFNSLRRSHTFTAFIIGLIMSTVAILIRTLYRTVKPTSGIDGSDETACLVLDGAMVLVACLALTMLHPGVALRRHRQPSKGPSAAKHGAKPLDDEY